MAEGVSTFRLYLMRLVYLLNFVFLSMNAWPDIARHDKAWDPFQGVAFSFWAALATLMALGVRYPLQMLPLFFIQLLYKSIWLIGVALPMSQVGRTSGLTRVFIAGAIVDLIVIPWAYVWTHYVRKPADRWK